MLISRKEVLLEGRVLELVVVSCHPGLIYFSVCGYKCQTVHAIKFFIQRNVA